MNKFLPDSELQRQPAARGITRKIMGHDENIMMVRVDFEKGSIGELHSHPHVQASMVIKGSFEVTIGGEKRVLNEGDAFFAPSGIVHGAECLTEGSVIDVFTPARKDFL